MAPQINLRIRIFMLVTFSCLLINIHGANYTIQSEDGDIIDCVNVYEQPAFRHPLLKNHTIQWKPSSSPPIWPERNESVHQSWKNYRNCPEGTIPIPRTNAFKHPKHSSNIRIDGTSRFKREYAKAFIQSGGLYYGTAARINVWKPATFDGESSVSQIWVQAGDGKDFNSIEAGWQVKPGGGDKPRLFFYWTRDNYKSTGCYNYECPGFVQVNNKIGGGSALGPISSFKGPQFHMHLIIHKDQRSGNWWLRFGNEEIGYWPNSIFTSLNGSASMITWGGEIENSEKNRRHTSTQMGSGHHAGLGFKQAAFIYDLKYIDGNGQLKEPNQLQSIVTNPGCYDLKVAPKGQNGFGVHFYFGGPGFSTNGHTCF